MTTKRFDIITKRHKRTHRGLTYAASHPEVCWTSSWLSVQQELQPQIQLRSGRLEDVICTSQSILLGLRQHSHHFSSLILRSALHQAFILFMSCETWNKSAVWRAVLPSSQWRYQPPPWIRYTEGVILAPRRSSNSFWQAKPQLVDHADPDCSQTSGGLTALLQLWLLDR